MGPLEKEATDAGRERGYDHANYVTAYGGNLEPEESEIEIPLQFLQVPTYYTASYLEGVQEYVNEQMDDAFPDLTDWREDEWCGNND